MHATAAAAAAAAQSRRAEPAPDRLRLVRSGSLAGSTLHADDPQGIQF